MSSSEKPTLLRGKPVADKILAEIKTVVDAFDSVSAIQSKLHFFCDKFKREFKRDFEAEFDRVFRRKPSGGNFGIGLKGLIVFKDAIEREFIDVIERGFKHDFEYVLKREFEFGSGEVAPELKLKREQEFKQSFDRRLREFKQSFEHVFKDVIGLFRLPKLGDELKDSKNNLLCWLMDRVESDLQRQFELTRELASDIHKRREKYKVLFEEFLWKCKTNEDEDRIGDFFSFFNNFPVFSRIFAKDLDDYKSLTSYLFPEYSGDYAFLPPVLATILVGDDPASQVYVSKKNEVAESLGFRSLGFCSVDCSFPKNVSEKELLEYIAELNDKGYEENLNYPDSKPIPHGILVQLPLPKHINTLKVLNAIDPEKDVDGLNSFNQGLLSQSYSRGMLSPCTAAGIMELLDYYEIETAGKHAVVVGRSELVGRPIATMLSQRDGRSGEKRKRVTLPEYYGSSGSKDSLSSSISDENVSFFDEKCGGDATVTLAHSKTKDLAKITRMADLLIVAAGSKNLIKADMVKEGAVVIDVGIHRSSTMTPDGKKKVTLVGDVDFEAVSKKVKAITPVPGGVGPMTIAMLMKNTLMAYKNMAHKFVLSKKNADKK